MHVRMGRQECLLVRVHVPADKRSPLQQADVVQERKSFIIGNDTPGLQNPAVIGDFSVRTQFAVSSL